MDIKQVLAKVCEGNGLKTNEAEVPEDPCGGGGQSCPTIYETTDGGIVFQMYTMPSDFRSNIDVPAGETLGYLPKDVAKQLLAQLPKDGTF